MSETFSKKEKAKKKARQKQDKAQKMKERKENNNKGKPLEAMMAYLDEDGNLTSTPPDMKRRKEINLEDIQLGAAPVIEDNETAERTGVISFFNEEKGYGFIIDDQTRENIFVHSNHLSQAVKERDKVTFEKVKTEKGFSAIHVKLNK